MSSLCVSSSDFWFCDVFVSLSFPTFISRITLGLSWTSFNLQSDQMMVQCGKLCSMPLVPAMDGFLKQHHQFLGGQHRVEQITRGGNSGKFSPRFSQETDKLLKISITGHGALKISIIAL